MLLFLFLNTYEVNIQLQFFKVINYEIPTVTKEILESSLRD